MARKIYPIPMQAFMESPAAMQLPASAFGMAVRLALHEWHTRLAPLPIADHELMHIARAHAPLWRRWKPLILQALDDWRPAAHAYFRDRENKATTINLAARRGGATRAAQTALARLEQSNHAPEPASDFHQYGITPQRQPSPPRPPGPDARPVRHIRVDTITQR